MARFYRLSLVRALTPAGQNTPDREKFKRSPPGEQRDEHIRRYAELLEAKKIQSPQTAAFESARQDGRGHRPKSIAREIADATGLSDDTVRRALAPKPTLPIKSVMEPESEQEAIIREANAVACDSCGAAPVLPRSEAGKHEIS